MQKKKSKGKGIPLQTSTGPEGSRRLRQISIQSAHEGGKVVSPKHRPPLPPSPRRYSLSRPQGHSATRRIMSKKNYNDTIGNRTRDLPACSAESVPGTSFLNRCFKPAGTRAVLLLKLTWLAMRPTCYISSVIITVSLDR